MTLKQLGLLGRNEIASQQIVSPMVGTPVREYNTGERLFSYGLGYYGYDIRLGVDFQSPCDVKDGSDSPRLHHPLLFSGFGPQSSARDVSFLADSSILVATTFLRDGHVTRDVQYAG